MDELIGENNVLRNDKSALEQEVQRLKVANAELNERNDNLQRENKSLSGRDRVIEIMIVVVVALSN